MNRAFGNVYVFVLGLDLSITASSTQHFLAYLTVI